MVEDALHEWRVAIQKRDWKGALFGASGILKDETLTTIASIGPVTKAQLERLLKDQWSWWQRYGGELYDCLQQLSIPPLVPKSKKAAVSSETAAAAAEGPMESKAAVNARPAGATSELTHTQRDAAAASVHVQTRPVVDARTQLPGCTQLNAHLAAPMIASRVGKSMPAQLRGVKRAAQDIVHDGGDAQK